MGLYKAQFISMIIMIALGIGMFVGFNMEWVSIEENTTSFFEKPVMPIIVFCPNAAFPRMI